MHVIAFIYVNRRGLIAFISYKMQLLVDYQINLHQWFYKSKGMEILDAG